jgi:hypothetical protein
MTTNIFHGKANFEREVGTMRKRKIYISIINILVLLELFTLNFGVIFGEKTVNAKDTAAKISSKPIVYENEYISVNIDLPVVSGINSNAQKLINDRIQDEINSSKNNVEKQAIEDGEQSKKSGSDIRQYNFTSKYKVTYNKNNILSIVLTIYQYTGGAHGSTTQVAYNFDTNTGKIGVLEDFFGEDKDYRSKILKEIRAEISKEPQNYFIETINNLNGIAYNQNFYLEDEAVVVYFDEYEIAPYAAGIPEFRIPYSKFKNGINTKVIILKDPVTVLKEIYKDNEENFQGYLSYPKIINLSDSLVETKINSTIKNEVLKFNDAIKSSAASEKKVVNPNESKKVWGASTYFKSYLVNRDLISIPITYSANNGTTENYILYDKGYTIDLTTGNLYKLKDVFKSGTNYIELINKEINSQIKEAESKANKKNIYNFKTINENTEFYIEKGNLIITFPAGQIAPKEYYITEFTIPMYKFNGLVNDKFLEH